MRPDPKDLGRLTPAQVDQMVDATAIYNPASWALWQYTKRSPEQLRQTTIWMRTFQILLHGASIRVAAYAIVLLRPEIAGQYIFALVCPCLILLFVIVHLLVVIRIIRGAQLSSVLGGKVLLIFEALAALLWFATWVTVTYDRVHQTGAESPQCTLRLVYLGLSLAEFIIFTFMVMHDSVQWPGYSMAHRMAAEQEDYKREAAANREYTRLPVGRVLDNSGKPDPSFVNTVPPQGLNSPDTRD